MAYRWPTDPKGKPASHTKSWEDHQRTLSTNAENRQAASNQQRQNEARQRAATPTTSAPDVKPSSSPAPVNDPTTSAPLPIDPIFEAEMAGLDAQRSATTGALQGERTRGLAEYGFTEGAFDPSTQTMGALAFDPNNPFSKASLLKKTYDTSRSAARQSMGSRGQLYAGAFQNQQDLLNRKQLGDEDTLQKSLIGFLAGNNRDYTQALTDYEIGGIGARSDQVERAPTNPLYSPSVPIPAAAPAAPAAPAAGGIGTPATRTNRIPALKNNTLTAGPGVRSTRGATATTKRRGRTRTHTTSVKGP